MNRRALYAGGLALVIIASGNGFAWTHLHRTADRLLRADPTDIRRDPMLMRAAVEQGRPLYQSHCAACHGSALQGDPHRGVPNLANGAWLYGNDPVNVEHTILYGIRSGHPKAHNVADMPAMVRIGQITEEEAWDIVEFVQSLAGAPHDQQMASRGRALYDDKGNCFDCHASDAQGSVDYGVPGLTGPNWLYGGDRQTLYQSILDGRHGVCPAWVDKLTPVQIRVLTLYMVSAPPAIIVRH